MKRLSLILIIALLVINFKGICQDRDSLKTFRIETRDGNEYVGNILKTDSLTFKFKTTNIGIISIFRIDIVRIKEIKQEQFKDGAYWFENLQSTRYFWAPNGYGLQKGEAYYQNMWIFYNQAGYGFSNYFSIGAGMVPLFLFGGAPTPI